MGENNLEETTSEKDLGIHIDNKLRLFDHVDAAVNKANMPVGLIKRSYEDLDGDMIEVYKLLTGSIAPMRDYQKPAGTVSTRGNHLN